MAFSKSTDIRVSAVRTKYEHHDYRAPMKFGGMTVDKVTILNVECDVVTRDGKKARGFGSMPFSNIWAYPSRVMNYDQTLGAMTTLAVRCARLATRGLRGVRPSSGVGRRVGNTVPGSG